MAYNARFGQVAYAAGTSGSPAASAAYPINITDYAAEEIQGIVNNYNFGVGISGRDRSGSAFSKTAFDMELIGTNTADATTPLGALWRAAGFREASQGTTPNIAYKYTLYNTAAAFRYIANSGDVDAIDLALSIGETLDAAVATQAYTLSNAVCRSLRFSFRQNEIPTCAFEFVGQAGGSGTTSAWGAGVSATWNSTADPVNADNLTLTVGGATPKVRSFEIAITNNVNQRPDRNEALGYSTPVITSRDVLYTLQYETLPIATFNPGTLFKAGTKQALSMIYNTGGGVRKKLTITSDMYVNTPDRPAPDGDVQVSTITFKQSPISGDELDLAFSTS